MTYTESKGINFNYRLQSEGSPTAHDTCGTGPESEAHTVTGYKRFSKWNGHKTFTDCSEPVLYKRYNEE